MTIAESRYMECVPNALRKIAECLTKAKPRLVKVTPCAYVNPQNISSIAGWEEGAMPDNDNGGRVNLAMNNGAVFETFFLTTDEALKALDL